MRQNANPDILQKLQEFRPPGRLLALKYICELASFLYGRSRASGGHNFLNDTYNCTWWLILFARIKKKVLNWQPSEMTTSRTCHPPKNGRVHNSGEFRVASSEHGQFRIFCYCILYSWGCKKDESPFMPHFSFSLITDFELTFGPLEVAKPEKCTFMNFWFGHFQMSKM